MNTKKKLLLAGVCVVIVAAATVIGVMINREMQTDTYKLTYKTLIKQYAAEYDLDPYLVAAVIHVESGNRSDAVSSAGAVGLMQVMPDTGEWIAGKLKLEYDPEDLLDPQISIEMGCWYLNFLLERFPVKETAVAAYNAGHNRVSEWLKDQEYSTDKETLHYIPYAETRQYVEKVRKAQEKYTEIYPSAFAD